MPDSAELARSESSAIVAVDRALSASTRDRLAASIAANTSRAYARTWDGRASPNAAPPTPPGGFLGWCIRSGRAPLPATPETLAEWVNHLCDDGKAPSTIEQALAAVRTVHHLAGHDRPDADQARRVLRAHRRARADAGLGAQRQALPVEIENLRKLVEVLDVSGPIGYRDHVLLLLGVSLFGRRSELSALDWDDVSKVPEGLMLRIRRSKTDQDARGENVPVLHGAFPRTDPVRVLEKWRGICERQGITGGAILRSVDRHNRIGERLSPQGINVAVQRLAVRAGLGSGFSAHSLRAGAATIAYKNGAPISTICRMGRWKQGSPVVLGYIRAVDQWKDHPFQGVL